ncbi:uncharacterized protein LOC110018577 [Phalaenopsis equestris]|uniref:uncharacterized protein LOC110018577 n=1 Tax=Phalaenopsis equestris TaxID=78828 RepID=UPI0009E577D2|nr:uncharacterized protein LOC110018577 [Phalaenopsis equestris]
MYVWVFLSLAIARVYRIWSEQKNSKGMVGFWKCSVCTYENDGNLSSCYICGVFQDSFNMLVNKGENQALDILEKSTSVMARSLFAGKPRQRAVISSLSDNLQDAFPASISKHSITIVPFRFDTLSPDDIVSAERKKPKDHLATTMPPVALPSSTDEKKMVKL